MTNKLQSIPLEEIIVTKDNPRTIREDDPKMIELAASIKTHGVLEPVLCRPHENKKAKYELRAGARRFIAAGMAGLKEIPAIVREMTDQEAFEVTIIENLQRDNLSPIEEARGINSMIAKGWKIPDVAAHIGKSASWVVRRTQLTALSERWQKEIEDPKGVGNGAPAGHLELIARLPEDAQNNFLSRIKQQYSGDKRLVGYSAKRLDEDLGGYIRNLRNAKWSLADEDLVSGAGACLLCQTRSSHQPGLFDDFDAGEDILKKNDRCLNPDCWEKKLGAFTVRKHKELKKEHSVVLLGTDYNGSGRDKPFVDGQTVNTYLYDKAKKDAPGAIPLMTVNGDNAGRVEWVKPRKEDKSDRLAKEQKAEKKELGNSGERQRIADWFATAWISDMYAYHMFVEPTCAASTIQEREMALAATLIEMKQQNAAYNDEARDWLEELLGIQKAKINDEMLGVKEAGLTYRLVALGIFDYVHSMSHPFSGEPKKTEFKFPKDIEQKAAETFIPPRAFFEKHRKDDLVVIGTEMGLPVKASMRATDLKDTLSKASDEFRRLRAGEVRAMPEKWAGYFPMSKGLANAFGQPWTALMTVREIPAKKRGRPAVEQKCRLCGCTETTPCSDIETGETCHWIKPNLCSACVDKVKKNKPKKAKKEKR